MARKTKRGIYTSHFVVSLMFAVIFLLVHPTLLFLLLLIGTFIIGYLVSQRYNLDWIESVTGARSQNTGDAIRVLVLLLIAVVVVFAVRDQTYRIGLLLAYMGFLSGRYGYKYQLQSGSARLRGRK